MERKRERSPDPSTEQPIEAQIVVQDIDEIIYDLLDSSSPDLDEFKKCLMNGGDFQRISDDENCHSLCRVAACGPAELFEACMEAPYPIDFTKGDVHDGQSIMHIIALESPCPSEMMQALLRRIQRHPEDTIDWKQKSFEGKDFLTVAGECQRLSILWPLVESYFPQRPIKIGVAWIVDLGHLCASGCNVFKVFDIGETVETSPSTARLWQLVEHCEENEEIILKCLAEGADINFSPPHDSDSIATRTIKIRSVTFLRAYMGSMHMIDFTQISGGESLLHVLASERMPPSIAVEMLQLICERLEKHPLDKVDWGQKNEYGEDFLTLAADNQLLSSFWPLIKEMPFFGDRVEPFALPLAWEWDLEALSPDDRKNFTVEDVVEASHSTARLWKMHLNCAPRNEVKECIAEGADVHFYTSNGCTSLLELAAFSSDTALFNIFMGSPSRIFFTRNRFFYGIVVSFELSNSYVTELFECIKERLDTHPDDLVDWGQWFDEKKDLIVLAAEHQRLSALWPVLKDVPFFSARIKPFVLPVAWLWDMESLPLEDRNRFVVKKTLEATEATGRLFIELKRRDPKVYNIRKYLKEGGDLHFVPPGEDCVMLKNLLDISRNVASAPMSVNLLMDAPYPLRFSEMVEHEQPVLHNLFYNQLMLNVIIERVVSHPEDVIDWEQRNYREQSLLDLMAEMGKLFDIWPLLRQRLPQQPFVIEYAYNYDFKRLSPEDQLHFRVRKLH